MAWGSPELRDGMKNPGCPGFFSVIQALFNRAIKRQETSVLLVGQHWCRQERMHGIHLAVTLSRMVGQSERHAKSNNSLSRYA
jgi:hypothetical protein